MNTNRFGETLRILRKQKNMSQKQIALDLNITPQTYSNYERGKRFPGPDMLCRLASFYGVSTDFLLSEDPLVMNPINLLPPEVQAHLQIFLDLPIEDRGKATDYLILLKNQLK